MQNDEPNEYQRKLLLAHTRWVYQTARWYKDYLSDAEFLSFALGQENIASAPFNPRALLRYWEQSGQVQNSVRGH